MFHLKIRPPLFFVLNRSVNRESRGDILIGVSLLELGAEAVLSAVLTAKAGMLFERVFLLNINVTEF